MTEQIDLRHFVRHVKDALACFYDPAHLQTHPLVELLLPGEVAREMSGARLRHVLAQAVERLKPDEQVPFGRPEWLGFRVMQMCYLQSVPVADVCHELGLARSTFYRYHREALDAVASMLWEEYQRLASSQSLQDDGPAPLLARSADQEAIRIASLAERQWIGLSEVLATALRISEPLAQQEGVNLRVQAPPILPQTYGDPAMLGQILVNILSEAIAGAVGDALQLDITVEREQTMWRVHSVGQSLVEESADAQMAISRGLLGIYGGQFWLDAKADEGGLAICFTLPTLPRRIILIVDDDADAIRLYQRYLSAMPCMLLVARDAQDVASRLAEMLPDLILLDVLMPNTDGWSILRDLKAKPETAGVPVVICSVISQPRLALALGAAAVLQKPFDREDLWREVERFLPRRDHLGAPVDSKRLLLVKQAPARSE
jgi:CheY-like chemotaxis protein